ncbi:hypothetical protein ACHQM5_002183 [Ranunculus cassubicifolius]
MPQDSLRSVVYRSLVCNDPNGVVEYGTMRKSKSRKEQKKKEKLGNSSLHKEKELFSEQVKEESNILPPIQISEVSRGAQKLNLMIDSWSKGLNFDGQSKDIARDLLKGALDLQESLVMLCKLQEASNYLGQMKKKPREKYLGGKDDSERNGHSEMQLGRRSVDGSTKSSVEELKKVIRDSLTKQKLVSTPSVKRKDSFLCRYAGRLDDFSDIPSTSSSQSSVVQSNNATSMDWSVSSTYKEMKEKSPSLIAKLMGLEEFPSARSPRHLKQFDSKKSLDCSRLASDIEMPNARDAYFLSRNKESERKTLKEVIDTMHLKGLLKGNSVEGLGMQRWNSYNSNSDEMPPIVLIKPLHFPFKEKEDCSWRTSSPEVRSSHSFRESESSNISSTQGEVAQKPEETHSKLDANEAHSSRTSLHNEESLKPILKSDRVQRQEASVRSSIREERASNSKDVRRKQEVRGQRTRDKDSVNKAKLPSAPVFHKSQDRGASNKKIDQAKKFLPNRNVPVAENEKSVKTSRHPDQDTATSRKFKKHQESTTPSLTSVRSKQSKAESSLGQAKNNATRNIKSVKESLPTTSMTKRSKNKQPDKVSKLTNKMKAVSTLTSSDLDNHKHILEETEPSQQHIADHSEAQVSSLCEVQKEISKDERITESTEIVSHTIDMGEVGKGKLNLNELLLSNPSFLRYAADLFELPMKQPIVLQSTFTEEANMIDTRLFSDCANELMEYKSRQISQIAHPLLIIHMVNPRPRISLDQLLEEVCQDLEKLKNYIKVVDEAPHTDSIHKMLETDIKCSGAAVNGMWDSAWENGLSVNEADQVLGEVERLILSDLIEEIIVDYSITVVQNLHSL